MAVAKYAWSGRERLGLLRVRVDVIVLHAMRWPDEIRSPKELLPPPVELTDEEIDSALTLMDTMPAKTSTVRSSRPPTPRPSPRSSKRSENTASRRSCRSPRRSPARSST
ncbi:Ku protein [Streptomyces coeruleorubidus]|uniref:Ku protein n=1 Tax=Streptomyces coeruleorubidus TaxID=116188 RepID=UPI0037BB50B6